MRTSFLMYLSGVWVAFTFGIGIHLTSDKYLWFGIPATMSIAVGGAFLFMWIDLKLDECMKARKS